MDNPIFNYPFPEFIQAFNHSSTQTGFRESGEEFMRPWFARRYEDAAEQAYKFKIFVSVMEYLSEYREQLDAASVTVMGSHESGDLAHPVLLQLVFNHFKLTDDIPHPEQVIKRTKEIVAGRKGERN